VASNDSFRSSRWPLIVGAVLCLLALPAAYFYDNQRQNEALAEKSRATSRQFLAKAKVTPINPEGRIELKGHVQLFGAWSGGRQTNLPDEERNWRGKFTPLCDVYCSTILKIPDVKSVTIKWTNGIFTRFSLRNKGNCTSTLDELTEPKSLAEFGSRNWALRGYDTVDMGELGRRVSENGATIAVAWKALFAKTSCIQTDFVEQEPDFVLDNVSLRLAPPPLSRRKLKDSFVAVPVQREGLTIWNGDGQIVFRRAFAMTTILTKPFKRSFYMSGGIGTISDMGIENARELLTDYSTEEGAALSRVISEHTNILEGLDWQGPIDDLAADLRDALADPARTKSDPAIDYAPIWIESLIAREPNAEEWALLGALIADQRIQDLSGVYDVIRWKKEDAVILASFMKKRIAVEPTESQPARLLSSWLCDLTDECPDMDTTYGEPIVVSQKH